MRRFRKVIAGYHRVPLGGGRGKLAKPPSKRELRQLMREHKEKQARRAAHLKAEQWFETYRAAFIMCIANNRRGSQDIARSVADYIEKRRPAPFKE